jgi:hypothetical protein
MRVHWTENAIGHLVNIYEYIALNSPTFAKRMVDKITAGPSKSQTIHFQDEKCRNTRQMMSAS